MHSSPDILYKNDSPYEKTLSIIGFGKFHVFLYIACAMANLNEATETLCVSFLLPAAECDLNMTSSDKGLLTSMTFLGMLIGGYFWGILSDIFGRKYTLQTALIVSGVFGVLCGLSQTFIWLLVFRLVSGIGVGGSVPIVWSYFSEFIPKHIRGRMICALASSWLLGNLLVVLFAYIILDGPDFGYSFFNGFININNWRVFMIVCALPSFLTAFLLAFLPESPKYHLYNGHQEKGQTTLKLIYSINNRGSSLQQLQKKQEVFDFINRLDLNDDQAVTNKQTTALNQGPSKLWEYLKRTSAEAVSHTIELFKPPLVVNTLLVLTIYFGLCFGYYGLWMWLPELFSRMAITGGSPCNVQNILLNTTQNSTTSNSTCRVDSSIYMSTFISSLSNLPANIITVIWIDKIGRNLVTSVSLLVSGVAVFGIPFIQNETQGLILASIFGGINTFTFNSFGCTSTEIFPTRLRTTAMGVNFVSARIGAILGNIIFGLAVDINCYIPLCTIAFLMVLSGLLSFKLPESSNIDTK